MPAQSSHPKVLQISNILAFVVVLVVNGLSNAVPLNGRTAGEISDALPSFFTPAGYTFSIWGVIYLALLGFIAYQALPAQRERPFLGKIGWLFAASCAANAAWIFSWHYGAYALSVLLMVTLLMTLIAIYSRLDIGRPRNGLPTAERILVHLPFSLYLAWISVATIANVSSVLGYYGWNGFGIDGPIWSALMMGVAVIVALVLLMSRRDLGFAAVLIWAIMGIRSAHMDVVLIANVALAAAILILIAAVGLSANVRAPA